LADSQKRGILTGSGTQRKAIRSDADMMAARHRIAEIGPVGPRAQLLRGASVAHRNHGPPERRRVARGPNSGQQSPLPIPPGREERRAGDGISVTNRPRQIAGNCLGATRATPGPRLPAHTQPSAKSGAVSTPRKLPRFRTIVCLECLPISVSLACGTLHLSLP
jgi:hypothetical protein